LNSKSCQPERYAEYVAGRCKTEAVLEAYYRHPRFRAHRFTAFLRSKASVKAFAEGFKAKYGPGTLLMVGDWSASTNVQLRNQAPTMGVGLLRCLAAEGIRTALTCEAYTSSICPACVGRVEASGVRHHLLRCPHCPYKWWDVLGARNILRRGAHLLQHGVEDPIFVAAA
jgi:transposase